MKVFLSCDLEGTAGIVDWSQCRPPGIPYEVGRRLLLDEVNAALAGAVEAGASELVVNDSHGSMANLDPGAIGQSASYLSGRNKACYMMEGLDESFGAILFISYHGSMGSAGVLSHTYNPRAIAAVRLNGTTVGESGLNALVALHYRVPVVAITGDQVTIAEAEPVLPGIEGVIVKQARGRFVAESLHPDRACAAIRAGTARAIGRARAGQAPLPAIALPATLEVDFLTADQAEMATWIAGVRRVSEATVAFSSDSGLAAFRTFITIVVLTRSIAEI